jgi:hypothetical protein
MTSREFPGCTVTAMILERCDRTFGLGPERGFGWQLRALPLVFEGPTPGFWPLQPIEFIGYSSWHYCGMALGSTFELIPPRAQHPRAPRGLAGHQYQAVHFVVSGYAAEADPEPRSPMTLQGPVGALSLTLLVTGWVDWQQLRAKGCHRSGSRSVTRSGSRSDTMLD